MAGAGDQDAAGDAQEGIEDEDHVCQETWLSSVVVAAARC